MKASGGLRQGGVGQVTLGPSDKLLTGEREASSLQTQS